MLISVRRYRTTHLAYAGSVVLFAVLTALAARVTIPLPFTPVPVTLQVMVVLLAGLVLGARGGAVSQIIYLAAICAGLPLDARGLGLAALAGPTAGYLLGFTVSAFVTGWLAERLSASLVNRLVAALAGTTVIYACGVAWLAPAVGGLGPALTLGVAPFIVVDLVKALLAAALTESSRLFVRP